MKKPPYHIAQGQGGVHRVVSELIARGHEPYLPTIDSGVDILLGSGVRLQVKTTRRPTQHWRTPGAWLFSLSQPKLGAQHRYVAKPRQFSAQVDFIILHAIEAHRFWVVPAAVLDGRNTVSFKDGVKQWKDFDLAEACRLKAEGWSNQRIAVQLGANYATVRNRLNGSFVAPRRKFTEMSQYEDRWDLITGVLATLREATDVVARTQTPHVAGTNTVVEGATQAGQAEE